MKRSPLRRTRITTLRAGDPIPQGEPERYKDPKRPGYTRLRWKVGPATYVETRQRDSDGELSRDRPLRRINFERAAELYAEGLSTTQVADELGCSASQISRGLRQRGVQMRSMQAPIDVDRVLRLYREGHSVDDAARITGTSCEQASKVINAAGLMRKGGPRKSRRHRAYQAELERQRPLVLERAEGRCEVAVPGLCTGRADHVHHRRLRRQGGTNDLENLLAVCQHCHGYIHHHPAESYEAGWLIRSGRKP